MGAQRPTAVLLHRPFWYSPERPDSQSAPDDCSFSMYCKFTAPIGLIRARPKATRLTCLCGLYNESVCFMSLRVPAEITLHLAAVSTFNLRDSLFTFTMQCPTFLLVCAEFISPSSCSEKPSIVNVSSLSESVSGAKWLTWFAKCAMSCWSALLSEVVLFLALVTHLSKSWAFFLFGWVSATTIFASWHDCWWIF